MAPRFWVLHGEAVVGPLPAAEVRALPEFSPGLWVCPEEEADPGPTRWEPAGSFAELGDGTARPRAEKPDKLVDDEPLVRDLLVLGELIEKVELFQAGLLRIEDRLGERDRKFEELRAELARRDGSLARLDEALKLLEERLGAIGALEAGLARLSASEDRRERALAELRGQGDAAAARVDAMAAELRALGTTLSEFARRAERAAQPQPAPTPARPGRGLAAAAAFLAGLAAAALGAWLLRGRAAPQSAPSVPPARAAASISTGLSAPGLAEGAPAQAPEGVGSSGAAGTPRAARPRRAPRAEPAPAAKAKRKPTAREALPPELLKTLPKQYHDMPLDVVLRLTGGGLSTLGRKPAAKPASPGAPAPD